MMVTVTQPEQVQKMIEAVEQMREVVRGMVAALVDDGFTDAQARAIVAGLFGGQIK